MHSGLTMWFAAIGRLWLVCTQYSNFMLDLSIGYSSYLEIVQ